MPERDAVEEARRVVARVVFDECAWEARLGFMLAYFRTFASPSISHVLAASGETTRAPRKRAMDTYLFMYTLVAEGFESPAGRRIVAAMRRQHHPWSIGAEDYTYVLATFVVVPPRTIAAVGPRALTEHELEAFATFFGHLGTQMRLAGVPSTFVEFARDLDGYEASKVGQSPDGSRLAATTAEVLRESYPWGLRGFARCLVESQQPVEVRRALGYRDHRWVAGVLRVRQMLRRWSRRSSRSTFVPGAANSVYPRGYTVADLGPEN